MKKQKTGKPEKFIKVSLEIQLGGNKELVIISDEKEH